jgi:chemotaxis signal transduction protein
MRGAEINPIGEVGGFAQGIHCGELALALPYGWSRMVVDEFALTPVPRAPFWLVGASSINGTVTPVIDLQRFVFGEAAGQNQGARRKQRLLVGGISDTESNKTLGILFDGLPIQIERGSQFSKAADAGIAQLNDALTGQMVFQSNTMYRIVSPDTLYEVLSSRLSRH